MNWDVLFLSSGSIGVLLTYREELMIRVLAVLCSEKQGINERINRLSRHVLGWEVGSEGEVSI